MEQAVEPEAAHGVLFFGRVVVVLGAGDDEPEFLVVTWSLDTKRYEVAQMVRATVRAEGRDGTRRELEMWMNQGSVDFGEDPEIAAAMVAGCAEALRDAGQ